MSRRALAALVALAALAACGAPRGPQVSEEPGRAEAEELLAIAAPGSLYAGWSIRVPGSGWRADVGDADTLAVLDRLDAVGAAPLRRIAGAILAAGSADGSGSLVFVEVNPTTEAARAAETLALQSGQVPTAASLPLFGRTLAGWSWSGGFGLQTLAAFETAEGVRCLVLATAAEAAVRDRLLAALAGPHPDGATPTLR